MPNPVPHRRSIRLPDFDYTTPAAYFVTICTHNRECLFGDVTDGVMRLNGWGEIVQQTWDGLPDHYRHVELDQFVIMPNHVHGIIVLPDDGHPGVGAPFMAPVGVAEDDPGVNELGRYDVPDRVVVGAPFMAPMGVAFGHSGAMNQGAMNRAPTLGDIVRGFKARCTHAINTHRHTPGHPVWQRNYYEHIIRDDRDLAAIRDYITTNPARWGDDGDESGRDESRPYV